MPRVTTVNKSRKDQGSCGRCGDPLPAGSAYRHWSFRYGGTYKRCMKPECTPRRADLTQNEVLQAAYDIAEEVVGLPDTQEEFKEMVVDLAGRIQDEVVEAIQEKMDNLEQGFGHTELDAYYNLEEQMQEVETWIEEVSELEWSDEFFGDSDACRECGLSEDDGDHWPDEDDEEMGWHDFEADEEFDGESAQEALQEVIGNCPL